MITNTPVYMGTLPESWCSTKAIKYISFSITDECNLRCTYCYFTHKSSKNVMSFETACKAVDDILTESLFQDFDGVVWEFIGGEPTIEMDLVDRISDYILYRMYSLNHKWLSCYRFMMCTNGLLYDSEKVQRYIKKHNNNIYIGITIDGTKEKHDLSRIKKDGSGSYDDVRRIIPLWMKQFGAFSTKATFAHNDLPFLKDSVISLWNLGLKAIAANVVYEDVWKPGDVEIYKQQLYELANYIIDHDLWDKCSVRFFDPIVGTPLTDETMRRNICGTGIMMAINSNGDYYPCVRFMPSAANKNNFAKLGSINEKVNPDRLRPFSILSTKNQSSEQCLTCDIAGGCSWCSGFNYDQSSIGTLFERQMFICEMHKANVEVNKYLWRAFELIKHRISPYRYEKLTSISPYNKYLYVICNSDFPSICEYATNKEIKTENISDETLNKVIDFCETNNFVPIFCGCTNLPKDYYAYQIVSFEDILSHKCRFHENYFTQVLLQVEDEMRIDLLTACVNLSNIIVSYKASQLEALSRLIIKLFNLFPQISINITMRQIDIVPEKYIERYNDFLKEMLNVIHKGWAEKKYFTLNVLTHELFANTNRSCGAGKNTYTMSPDGNIYLCPGFYYNDPENTVGSIDLGIRNVYSKYCDMDNAPLCNGCDIKHCSRCIFKNKIGTGEYHIPTEIQCVISHMEYNFSRQLTDRIKSDIASVPFEYNEKLRRLEDYDPLINIKGDDYPNKGYDLLVKKLTPPIMWR